MNLSIQQLNKTYANGTKAIDNLTLSIGKGMFGLLGPNGAGKSSLMRTIATLQTADSGAIHFKGENIFENKTNFRKTLGYLPQDFGVYPKDSAERLLDYFAVLKGIVSKKERKAAIAEVLEMTNLLEVRKKRVSTFSGGMRQRFGIAQLLLNRPQLIIVDEPTAGLDPSERSRFLNVLRNVGSSNIVIFSTHLVEDVRELCSEMAIINQGKLLTKIAPKAAVVQLEGKIWETPMSAELLPAECSLLSTRYADDGRLMTRVFSDTTLGSDFLAQKPKLEDYYFLTLNQ
ncbi:MAG: ABC transporter ATP-binding protein [Bacteroidota bacterium]